MKRKFSTTQKLLLLVAGAVLVSAFLVLLSIWGIDIDEKLVGRIFGTCLVIAVVAGIMMTIISNMREESPDHKDNFFN